MSIRPEDFRPGDRLGARELNEIRSELRRLGRFAFTPPIGGSSEGGGIAIWYDDPQPAMWVKLTGGGSGGKYDWTLQKATAAGGWADDDSGSSGTTTVDPIYEQNLNSTVSLTPNPVVRAMRNGAGILVFQSGSC